MAKSALAIVKKLGVKKTPDPEPSRKGTPRSQGKSTQLGICQFWATLFEANESLPKNRKMTDAEIKRQVMAEFPNRDSIKKLAAGKQTVNYHRQLYNRGRYTHHTIPTKLSRRYDVSGKVVNPRTGRALKKGENPVP